MANDFFERSLEDIIMDNLDTISDKGFPTLYKNTRRQFMLADGRFMDMFTWEVIDDVLYAKIIELKRYAIGTSALFQGIWYYQSILGAALGNFKEAHIELILVGNQIDSDLVHLSLLSNHLSLYEYVYKADGIFFVKRSFDNKCINDKWMNTEPYWWHDRVVNTLKSA